MGLIGAEVARLLVEQGEKQPVLFDLHPSSRRIEELGPGADVIRGDVGTFGHVLSAVKRVRPTVIYHLGAMLSTGSEADPAGAVRANALGTFHVLEAARLFDVRHVVFTSSIGTYGSDIGDGPLTNMTLQRPLFLYGATKLFGEHLGLFYRRTQGVDFRGVRFPSVVSPGVATPGAVQYISWMIETSAKGAPFTIPVLPETRVPVLYLKDAARALVELAAAPRDGIRTAVYLLAGPTPVPSAASSRPWSGRECRGLGSSFTRIRRSSDSWTRWRDPSPTTRPARNGAGSLTTVSRRWSTTFWRSSGFIPSGTPHPAVHPNKVQSQTL